MNPGMIEIRTELQAFRADGPSNFPVILCVLRQDSISSNFQAKPPKAG
jgi:hypothetical protein